MRVVLAAVLLCLPACSGPGAAAFRQAAPMPAPVGPPPAYTPGFAPGTPGAPVYAPAGAGMPEVGQPGQETANVPRSPNTRVLPVSDEPGLWAADDVRAAQGAYTPRIGPVEIPYPEDAQSVEDLKLTNACAASMSQAITDARQHLRFRNLPADVQRCLAAHLFKACAETLADAAKARRAATGAPDAEEIRRRQSTAWRAQAFVAEACSGLLLDDSQNAILDATIQQWPMTLKRLGSTP